MAGWDRWKVVTGGGRRQFRHGKLEKVISEKIVVQEMKEREKSAQRDYLG